MERLFGIDRSRGETETVSVERNYTYVEQSAFSHSYVLTLIVYGPRTPAELLAFSPRGRSPDTRLHRCMWSEKTPNRQLLTHLKNANENEGEEERDGKISGPIRFTKNAEKKAKGGRNS